VFFTHFAAAEHIGNSILAHAAWNCESDSERSAEMLRWRIRRQGMIGHATEFNSKKKSARVCQRFKLGG